MVQMSINMEMAKAVIFISGKFSHALEFNTMQITKYCYLSLHQIQVMRTLAIY